jgi:C1A family cysteine protease
MSPNAWYGCRRDLRDARDKFMAVGPVTDKITDLREWAIEPMNQEQIGSCTAHGTTAVARYHIKRYQPTYDFPMCRLQLYYDSRDLEGAIQSDSGAEIRDVVKTLATKGVGHEDLWKYDISKFTDRPPQEVYDDAVQYKALTYSRVPVSAAGLKSALAQDHPVIIGISVYDSFESEAVSRTGMVPMPKQTEGMVGGHCMAVFGWGQKPGHFTVLNSWGKDWGDNGWCYIPEAYLGSPTYGSDYWVINLFGSDAEQKAGKA